MAISDQALPDAAVPNSAAGVYFKEDDRSARLVAATKYLTIGAIVGASAKGPVGQPTFVSTDEEFIAKFGKPDASVSFMHHSALAFLEQSKALWVTRVADTARFAGCTVSLVDGRNTINLADARWGGNPATSEFGTAAQIEANGEAFDVALLGKGQVDPAAFPFQDSDLFIIYGISSGNSGNTISVDIIPSSTDSLPSHTFYLNVYESKVLVEQFLVTLADNFVYNNKQCELESRINHATKGSKYIRVKQNQNASAFVAGPTDQLIQYAIFNADAPLLGGDSGFNPSADMINAAWDYYRNKELSNVTVLINGGYTDVAIQKNLENIARSRGDCFAILDMPSDQQQVRDAVKYRNRILKMGVNDVDRSMDSTFAGLYTPDYLILDTTTDRRLYVPPSGFVAAAFAKTDKDWATWFAPAGVLRGKLNVIGVKHQYGQDDRDILSDNQINATRILPGKGICIWGADTLQKQPTALSNINVRRLMLFLNRQLGKASMYSVFNPNDAILRAEVVELCDRFLKPIKFGRGLYEYKVICDETNNSNDSIAEGDLIVDLYLDPILPAKRILVTFTINRTGVRTTSAVLN